MERKINQKLKIVEFESNYSPVAPEYIYSEEIANGDFEIPYLEGKKKRYQLQVEKRYF